MDKNNRFREASENYLRQHRIMSLFQDISTSLCFHQPDDVWSHILEQLKTKQNNGFKSVIIDRQEIENIFKLQDLRQLGYIDQSQTKQALHHLACSQLHTQKIDQHIISDKYDLQQFIALCNQIFDINV